MGGASIDPLKLQWHRSTAALHFERLAQDMETWCSTSSGTDAAVPASAALQQLQGKQGLVDRALTQLSHQAAQALAAASSAADRRSWSDLLLDMQSLQEGLQGIIDSCSALMGSSPKPAAVGSDGGNDGLERLRQQCNTFVSRCSPLVGELLPYRAVASALWKATRPGGRSEQQAQPAAQPASRRRNAKPHPSSNNWRERAAAAGRLLGASPLAIVWLAALMVLLAGALWLWFAAGAAVVGQMNLGQLEGVSDSEDTRASLLPASPELPLAAASSGHVAAAIGRTTDSPASRAAAAAPQDLGNLSSAQAAVQACRQQEGGHASVEAVTACILQALPSARPLWWARARANAAALWQRGLVF